MTTLDQYNPQFNPQNVGNNMTIDSYNPTPPASSGSNLNIGPFDYSNVGNNLTIDTYNPTFNSGNLGRNLTIDDLGNPNVGQAPSAQPGGSSDGGAGLFERFINMVGNNAGTIAGGLGGAAALNNAVNRLQQVGNLGFTQGQGLASTLYDATQFRPYTITTPTGASFTASAGGPMGGFPGQNYMLSGGGEMPNEGNDMVTPPPGFIDRIRQYAQGQNTGATMGLPTPTGGGTPAGNLDAFMSGGLPSIDPNTGIRGDYNPQVMPSGGPTDPTTAITGTDKGDVLDPNVATRMAPMQYTSTLSPREQAFYEAAFGGAGGMFGQALQGTGARTDEIFNRMQTALQPQMERQRLQQEERMAAQGRLGMSSNQFGGMAPEDFQMNLAQQEAMNNAYLGAMQQARGEQLQQANIGNMLLGASYVPQAQMLNALQPGMQAAAQEQAARLTGAGMFGESYASGIDALLASAMGQANLMGSLGSGLLSGSIQGANMGGGGGSDAVNYYNILKDFYESYIRG